MSGMVTRIGPKRPRRLYLQAWRESRGLTQQQLAERVETGKDQISRWESGKRGMSAGVIAALEEALQLEPGDLFRDPQQPSVDELLKNASPEERQRVFSVVQALLKTG
jgi:transcriptional regulator with XRE-family HTH domain